MASEELKSLKSRRSYVKGSVTRFGAYLKKLADKINIIGVENRYNIVKALFQQYYEIQVKISDIDISELNNEEISEFEDLYSSLGSQADAIMKSKRGNSKIKVDFDSQNIPA
ncbi:hypothetical protein Trydic_g23151 [Trypoxylus dichotomus]